MTAAEARADPCAYCQGPVSGTIDHVRPRARGGLHAPINWAGACPICNRLKSDMPLLIFLIKRGYPVQHRRFDRHVVSRSRAKKIRRAFLRLGAIEQALRDEHTP